VEALSTGSINYSAEMNAQFAANTKQNNNKASPSIKGNALPAQVLQISRARSESPYESKNRGSQEAFAKKQHTTPRSSVSLNNASTASRSVSANNNNASTKGYGSKNNGKDKVSLISSSKSSAFSKPTYEKREIVPPIKKFKAPYKY